MASFEGILSGLRRAEKELEAQLVGVRAAVASLTGGGGSTTGRKRGRPAGSKNRRGPGRPAGSTNDKAIIIVGGKTKRKRRKMSAKARAAISAAQKARWAKQKAGKK